jgi:hypothetical protein
MCARLMWIWAVAFSRCVPLERRSGLPCGHAALDALARGCCISTGAQRRDKGAMGRAFVASCGLQGAIIAVIFRYPLAASDHPPRNSFTARGNPLEAGFITTDRHPMLMEARHRLDQAIHPQSCVAIHVVTLHADRYLGTLSIEMVLIKRRSRRSFRLGKIEVTPEKSQVLKFPITAAAPIRAFDEFRVVFHRAAGRADRAGPARPHETAIVLR